MVKSAEGPASRQQAPQSVRNAVVLLRLQATIWALLSAGIVAAGSASLTRNARTPSSTATAAVLTVVFALATVTFAAVKFRLAYRLPRGTHHTREVVIGVETLMVCFAGLVLFFLTVSVTGLILSPPFIIGGIMSAWVVLGLTKPPAREYFDANEAMDARSATLRSPGGTSAQFRGRLATA